MIYRASYDPVNPWAFVYYRHTDDCQRFTLILLHLRHLSIVLQKFVYFLVLRVKIFTFFYTFRH